MDVKQGYSPTTDAGAKLKLLFSLLQHTLLTMMIRRASHRGLRVIPRRIVVSESVPLSSSGAMKRLSVRLMHATTRRLNIVLNSTAQSFQRTHEKIAAPEDTPHFRDTSSLAPNRPSTSTCTTRRPTAWSPGSRR